MLDYNKHLLNKRLEYNAFDRVAMSMSESDCKKNTKNLFQNLNIKSSKKLTRLLEIKNKILDPEVKKSSDVFNDKELKELEKVKKMFGNVKKINADETYYQYKNFKLPINYFEPSVFIDEHGIGELKTFKERFKNNKNDVIIDVGGYIGDSILVFRQYTENKIYSFEPNTKNYKLALKTLELNKLSGTDGNVVIENFGLGDKKKTETLTINDGAISSIIHKSKDNTLNEEIKIDTLDNYVKKYNLNVGLIKVDIEGYEQYFLRGAINTIKEQKPILLLSIYHNYDDFYKIKPFIENLDLGYKFDFFKGVNFNPNMDIMLLCEVYSNFI
jgi:FkbM family methyltransferase